MEKRRHYQLELFGRPASLSQQTEGCRTHFLSSLLRYEKTVLIIIGFIITAVSSFSLGVEKGKRSVISKSKPTLDIAIKKPVSAPPVQVPRTKEILVPQGFTIQLASYQTATYANKEAEKLKKKGLSPLVLPKGSYQVLCVGNFSDRKTAMSLLSELKKQYKDCFIRRL